MKRILLLLIISSPLLANKLIIEKDLILAPEKLGALKIIRTQGEFEIMKGSKIRKINSYDVDPILRKMNNEQLVNALVGAKIRVSQFSNKDYKLELAGGLKGGGPVLAGFLYGLTKAIGYGVPVTLATGAVVATLPVSTGAGVASGASAGTAALVKGVGGLAVKTAVGCTTAASTIGANVAANAVIGTVGTTAATNAVVGVTASTASVGGYIGFIEGLATTLWIWGMAAPTI